MDWISNALDDLNPLDRLRARLRNSELWFIALALLAGMVAGVLTVLQSMLAHGLQQRLFGLTAQMRLSAVEDVPVAALFALPLGGLVLGLFGIAAKVRGRAMVDAVEANALHGGRMSIRDSLVVSIQTLLSNGFGASVGLEAAYVQMGSGAASALGRGLHLRRADLRTLVGAGTGGAIAAAFGAPLTGAFYAFEIVMGAYTPAALAPVAAACIGAVVVAQALGASPYLIWVVPGGHITPFDYALYVLLAILCAGIGVILMKLVSSVEREVNASPLPRWLRPVLGGLLLIPLAAYTPQILSSGHGALSHDLVAGYSLAFVAILFAAKCTASVVSLGFGFRGGLFFASLFLGALAGHLFAGVVGLATGHALPNPEDAALVGMAALSVSIVGGPLTMSMLVLEATHDFALTSAVIAGALVCNTLVRATFGYSFSTWRLHLRGQTIKSPRDVGWASTLFAGDLMRREASPTPAAMTVAEFRKAFPLGSAKRVVLVDAAGKYAGIVVPAIAHDAAVKPESEIGQLARNRERFIAADMDIIAVLKALDAAQTDELAVVDYDGHVLGVVSEAFVRRRYAEELEKYQQELFGER